MPLLSLSPLVPRGPCLRPVRPGRSLSASGRGGSLGPVRDRIGDRYRRGRSGAYGREVLVVTGLPSGDRGEAPHVKETPQPLIAGRVVRGIDRLVVLAEELLALSFGKAFEDHQRIGGGLPSAVRPRDSAYARSTSSACPPHRPESVDAD